MTIRRLLASLLIAPLAAALMAQTAAPAPAGSASADPTPEPLKLYLMDGSVVAGKISSADLTVETQFGTLKVPIDSIKAFAPGLSSHPAFDKQLTDLINDLGADGFPEREKAQQALMKMGPQISPELKRHLKTAEAEKQTRIQKILEEFESQRDNEEADTSNDWTRDDVVVTNTFTIVGHITTPSFTVASSYGTLQLKLADIRRGQRATAEPEDLRKALAVPGNCITTRNYETALRVNKGDQISITASGTITMSPWGGNATSGPDGERNYGTGPGGVSAGALIAKIGTGSPFKVGSKHSMTADRAGVLQFSISMPGNYSGNDFPGEYQVKVRVVRKATN